MSDHYYYAVDQQPFHAMLEPLQDLLFDKVDTITENIIRPNVIIRKFLNEDDLYCAVLAHGSTKFEVLFDGKVS